MGQPLRKFLEEFPSEDLPTVEPSVSRLRPRAASAPRSPEAADMEAAATAKRLSEAYARGLEDGRSEARAQLTGEMERLQADYEQRLEHGLSAFSETISQQISEGLQHRLAQLHASLADQTVSALLPILKHALTEASIRELADALRTLAADGEAVTVELSGPEEMVERIWRRYCEIREGQHERPAPGVRLIHSETTEVRVRVDDAVVESRLMEWIARIAEAAG